MVIRLRWGRESGAPYWGQCPWKKRKTHQRPELPRNPHHVKTQQEAGPHQTPNLPVPLLLDFRPPALCEGKVCRLSRPVRGVSWQQPSWLKQSPLTVRTAGTAGTKHMPACSKRSQALERERMTLDQQAYPFLRKRILPDQQYPHLQNNGGSFNVLTRCSSQVRNSSPKSEWG